MWTPHQGGQQITDQAGRESWVTVGRKRKTKECTPHRADISRGGGLQPIPALAGVGPGPRPREREDWWATGHPDGHILQEKGVVGDSIIWDVDSIVLCTRKGFSNGVLPAWCPGRRYPVLMNKLLARARRDPVVMVHIGTNDIGKSRFEALQEKFVEFRSRTSTVVFSGILPFVPRASRGKQNFIWRFNTWLQHFRRKENKGFTGQGDSFWDRGELYKHVAPEGNLCNGSAYAEGSTGSFELGNWGAGRIESEMGREAKTAQMDTVKATYNCRSSNKKCSGLKF